MAELTIDLDAVAELTALVAAILIGPDYIEFGRFSRGGFPAGVERMVILSESSDLIVPRIAEWIRGTNPPVVVIAASGQATSESLWLERRGLAIGLRDLRRSIGLDYEGVIIFLNEGVCAAAGTMLLPPDRLVQIHGAEGPFRPDQLHHVLVLSDQLSLGAVGDGTVETTTAPRPPAVATDGNAAIYRWLKKKYGKVDAGQIIAGGGLELVFRALCETRDPTGSFADQIDRQPPSARAAFIMDRVAGKRKLATDLGATFGQSIYDATVACWLDQLGRMISHLLLDGGVVLTGELASMAQDLIVRPDGRVSEELRGAMCDRADAPSVAAIRADIVSQRPVYRTVDGSQLPDARMVGAGAIAAAEFLTMPTGR